MRFACARLSGGVGIWHAYCRRRLVNERILTGLVLLAGLGAAAQLLATHLKLPSILVLLLVGLVCGPLTGTFDPAALLGDVTFPLVSLGAAIILFEGGLTARIQDISDVKRPVVRMVTVGLVVTWVATSALSYFLLDLGLSLSCLLGAILVVTGPTVIGPILRHARPHDDVARTLKYEGILNDPLGALLAVIVFQVIEVERVETAVSLIALSVLKAALLATAIGALFAWLFVLSVKRRWIPRDHSNAVLFPLVLGAYALSNQVQHESGLLSVTVMGIALASQDRVDIEPNIEFAEHLRMMLIPVLFILLTARMTLDDLANIPATAVGFVLLLILLVRPAAVLLSTWRTKLSFKKRAFLSGMAPRGIVAAAVSSVFSLRLVEEGWEGAHLLMPITFLVICVCVVVYGSTARPLARALGLSEKEPGGVLILGANRAARELASVLGTIDVPVVLVDSNRRNVLVSRSAGLRAEHGRVLSEHVQNRLDLGRIGMLLALTSSEDANTLAATHYRPLLGTEHVHQVAVGGAMPGKNQVNAPRVQGSTFAPGADYTTLNHFAVHGRTKVTPLTKEFDYAKLLAHYQGRILPLFVVSEPGAIRVIDGDSSEPKAGEQVVSFVLDESSNDSLRTPVTTPSLADAG